jgi:conjugal transfer pilus assembly protein TraV
MIFKELLRMKILNAGVFTCVLLSGCANLNEDFDCPAPKGGSCKRMDQIYAEVNGNNLKSNKPLAVAPIHNPLVLDAKAQDPIRYKEGVVRIWIAPYEDTDGNYHQANQIYSVVKEGHWIAPVHKG